MADDKNKDGSSNGKNQDSGSQDSSAGQDQGDSGNQSENEKPELLKPRLIIEGAKLDKDKTKKK